MNHLSVVTLFRGFIYSTFWKQSFELLSSYYQKLNLLKGQSLID